MKAKKLLALTLALILALSCMSITAFAATQDCTNCNGAGTVKCTNTYCVNGMYICPECKGTGMHGNETCSMGGSMGCPICKTKGVVECPDCNGKGKIVTPELQYQQIVSTVINGTDNAIKIGTITGYLGFKAGDILTSIDVVKNAKNDAKTETTIVAEFGDQTDENDKNNFYIDLKEKAENGTYYVRMKTTQENTTVYTYIPFAVVNTILDLEEGDDYLDTKTGIEQTYTATVTTNKTDKTKVQVSWKLENIAVSVTNNKVWDTEKLIWVDDTANQNTATANDVTAEFNFVNLSSVEIFAEVDFEANEGFTPGVKFEVDDSEADLARKMLGSKALSDYADINGKIEYIITPGENDFAGLTESVDDAKVYGVYTVRIYHGKDQ